MTTIGSDSSFRDGFLIGAAKAFFVTAYADFVEDDHDDLSDDERDARAELPRPGPGEDWEDYAPEPPPAAYALAGELWAGLHYVNGVSVYSLAERAREADGTDPDPEEFGFCLAMQAMGHGVSWFDDHGRFGIAFPHMEVSQFSFAEDAYGINDR